MQAHQLVVSSKALSKLTSRPSHLLVNRSSLFGHSICSKTHFGREGAMRSPLGRGTGRGLFHHLVHLLKSETLGLRDQEVRVHKSAGAQRAPDEEYLGLEVTLILVDHVGGNDGDDLTGQRVSSIGEQVTYAIPQPV